MPVGANSIRSRQKGFDAINFKFVSTVTKLENSYAFVNALTESNLSSKCFMASYDVSNLFTNIPLDETITIILNSLFSNHDSLFLGMTRELFKTFLEYSVKFSFFIFNGKLHKQCDGLGMGLPLAPTFANIFMCNLERKYIETCPEDFSPLFYRRYVDDTFVAFRDKNHASLFLDFVNQQHPNISFTMECETDNKLAFLDALVCRNTTGFDVSVHRKSTFSGLVISFFSYCAHKFKGIVPPRIDHNLQNFQKCVFN